MKSTLRKISKDVAKGRHCKVGILETGEIFKTANRCRKELGVSSDTLYKRLAGVMCRDIDWINHLTFYLITEKYCKYCGDLLTNENFNLGAKRKKYYVCKSCYPYVNDPKRWKDVDFKSFQEKVKNCNGKCELCGQPEATRQLATDHNHKNQTLRGRLCTRCNTAVGLLDIDNFGIELLEKAIEYVKKYE